MYTATKALPVITILDGLALFHHKKYCYPSQKKLLELLESRLFIKISIATLNRWLRAIEDEGYVNRLRRIKRDDILGMVFKSTLYTLRKKSYVLLARAKLRTWDRVNEQRQARAVKSGPQQLAEQLEQNGKKRVKLSDFLQRHPGKSIPWKID